MVAMTRTFSPFYLRRIKYPPVCFVKDEKSDTDYCYPVYQRCKYLKPVIAECHAVV